MAENFPAVGGERAVRTQRRVRRPRRALWWCAAVAAAQTVAAAQIAAQPALGLEEALAHAIAANPMLVALGHQTDAARGRLRQARIPPNPALDIAISDALGSGDFRGARSAETTVSIAWVLERGIRLREVDAALADVSLNELEARIARLDTAAETARRFLACLAFQARLANAGEGLRLAGQAVAAVRSRVAAGGAMQAELARAEADLVRAELLEEDYTHELLGAYHLLSEQWGEPEPDFASVTGDVRRLPDVEPLQALLSRAQASPDLALFMSRRRLSEAELRVAQARGRPDWLARAGVRRIESSDDLALVGEIVIPLGARDRNLGRMDETRADMARALAEGEATRVRTETGLFVLYQELQHNLQAAAALRDRMLPLLESALADTRRAYGLGRSSYAELSAVQSELLQANNELLEAAIGAHGFVIEIERLTGVPYLPGAEAQ